MIGTFPGKLALVEGDEVDVDLEIAGGRLRLTTGVSEIGAWPLDACLVTALPTGAYELTLDGERVAFSPDHPDAFSAVVARMTPVESPPSTTGYDLEAALDQVLGGNSTYEVPGLVEESAAEIAVTLEALFATAYPDYDLEDEDEPDLEFEDPLAPAIESDPVPDGSRAAADVAVPTERLPEPEPAPDPIPIPPAAPQGDPVDIWSASPDVPVEPEADDRAAEPMVDVSGWVGEDHDVPVWSPEVVGDEADHTGAVAEPFTADSLPADRSELGARWRPGAVEPDETDEVAGTHDDLYRADEPEDVGVPSSWRVSEMLDATAHTPEPAEASLDQEIDDVLGHEPSGDEHPGDEEADDEDAIGRGYGQLPPSERDNGFGRGGPPGGWPVRPAPRSPEFGDTGVGPDRGFTRGSEFDLEGAAASAGYSMPDDDVEMEEIVERIPARRGMGGIFSKSAGERFSAVAGAMRDHTDSDEDEDTVSVADQILASQEQLRSGSKVVRFTPALVKKVTIGMVIVMIVAGFVLITPTVIGFLVDRVQSEANVASPATTIPIDATTVAPAPSTTVPADQTTAGGIEVVDAQPVFQLDSAEFVDRWNDTGSRVAESLVIGDAPEVGPFGLGFTRYLGMEGIVSDGGLIESYTVVVDPLGDPQDDQLGIQAFGVAINVAEPEATGPELSSILLDMGLDVANPVVEGLGGSTSRNDVTYALEYDGERQLIRLTITSGTAVRTDTTAP